MLFIMGGCVSYAAGELGEMWRMRDPIYRFRRACDYDNVEVVRELKDARGRDPTRVYASDRDGFETACGSGSLEVVREMLSWTGDRRVNVHANQEGAFRAACWRDKFEVVRILLALEGDRCVNVHALDNVALYAALRNNSRSILRLLLSLDGGRRISSATLKDTLELILEDSALGDDIIAMILDELVRRDVDPERIEELFQTTCAHSEEHTLSPFLELKGRYRVCSVDSVEAAVIRQWSTCRKAWRRVATADAMDAAAQETEKGYAKLAAELRAVAVHEADGPSGVM